MNSLKLSKRVIGIALSVLFVNAALADATSDARIQAYKANKLIPQNVVLSTSTGAADSDEVVVFNKGTLSWKSDNALSASYTALLEKYGAMTIDELRVAMGPEGTWDWDKCEWAEDGWLKDVTPEHQEIRDYLSLIANNKLKSDNLGSDEALAYLQEQFDLFTSLGYVTEMATLGAFPCEGLDFTGRTIDSADLTGCIGITGDQLMSAEYIVYTKLPVVEFTGNESFAGKSLNYTDFSNCTGITGEQIMSAGDISSVKLPAITFTGNESFAGKNLEGVDLSKCTGITAAQIMSASSIMGAELPALTFTGNESFAGIDLFATNLSLCSGITAAQIMSASDIAHAQLPAITFTGNEPFAGKDLSETDFSRCTGITGEQIISAGNLTNTKLPAITFTGNESFARKSLSGYDLTNYTGITAAQIGSAGNISNMRITTAQYNEWKSTLQSKFNGKNVYVDGVRTKIQ